MTTLTEEQLTILRRVHTTQDSLIIDALAGTGKTSTLIELIKILPQASALVLAFNRPIADEMAGKLPPIPRNRIVHVKTLHAAGLWILNQHFPRLVLDKNASEELISEACSGGVSMRVRAVALKLLRLAKDFQYARELDADFAFHLGSDFALFDKLESGQEMQRCIEIVQRAYTASLDLTKRKTIDFPDMGWLPLVLDLQPPSRYRAILLDEAQDVNPNQLEMVERLLVPGGRIIAAGDLNQQIYGWRGAVGDAVWARLRDHHKASSLPLTTTWRCDRAIVAEANQLVPGLRARPDAGDGLVSSMPEADFHNVVDTIDGSVFVLSRTNAELLRVALEMWRKRTPFNVRQSVDVLLPLKGVLRKLLKGDVRQPVATKKTALDDAAIEDTLHRFHLRLQQSEARVARTFVTLAAEKVDRGFVAFRQSIAAWYMTEMMKANAAGSSTWAERIDEQHRMLLYCLNYVADPWEIEGLLDGIYSFDDTCWITLSTVHKAKGLEADHVFLLRETFMRYQNRKDREGRLIEIPQEEENILYVAITRAKRTLTWVQLERGQ